jgi:metal-responsive CopG/Arc/MetJ family transcriptional regulator
MKEKSSITLSREVLAGIDRLAGSRHSRSAIERAVRNYLKQRERASIYARDIEIVSRAADRLNAEAEDTIDYQADPWRPEME